MADGDGFAFLQSKADLNGMDTDEFSLIDDIFLANELSPSIPLSTPSLGDSPVFCETGNDAMNTMKTTIDEGKPFESFEKQITITVPQPPPLEPEAISIGQGLFQGKQFRMTIFRFQAHTPILCVSFDLSHTI